MGTRAHHRQKARLGFLVGYAPLLMAMVLIAAVVMLAPSDVPSGPSSEGSASDVVAGDQAEAQTASGWGETVEPCENRASQVDSGYSPPCFSFSGDNGGATAPGVTGDTIRISHRYLVDGHLPATFANLAGRSLDEDAEDIWESTEALVEYFNENFQFYGRKLEVVRFDGKGSLTVELFGGGQENANVDARTALDLEVFADVNSFTQPYSEALADQRIIAIGAPYMSREWFQNRAPYVWSNFPDCTFIAELSASLASHHLMDEPASFAGGDLAGRRRRLGIVYPNTTQYTRCGKAAERIYTDAGHEIADIQSYSFEIGKADSNATAVLAKLRDRDITTVACGCDPIMVQALARKAEQQGYQPEWFILGTGFVDWDLVGQVITNGSGSQWSRAFGVTPSTRPEPFGQSEAYRAFKTVRPDEEPSQFIDLNYAILYRLAIGIHMAGPNLTPESFAQGMLNYPGGTGALGAWKFSPTNYTGVADARMVYWNTEEPSPLNGLPGTYVDVGERFTDPAEAPSQAELEETFGV